MWILFGELFTQIKLQTHTRGGAKKNKLTSEKGVELLVNKPLLNGAIRMYILMLDAM